jgi:hypothetical protein
MLAIASGVQAQPVDGQVLVLYWYGGGVDNNLDNLTGNARFPDNPDEAAMLTALDHPDRDGLDYWGAQLLAILTPPETGDYTFWTASDDDSEVWLSTDTDPANATLICSVEGWTGYQDYAGSVGSVGDNTQSAPIPLVAGQQYYIEYLFSDGTGGGHGSVAWAGPGIGDEPTMITGEYLAADEAWIPASVFQARDPKPADGELDVIMPLLEWTPGPGAVLHTVYFGDSPETLAMMMPSGAPVYFHALPLTPGATYYWRIDETTEDGAVYEGQVWSFTVQPLEASRPSPADGAVWVPTDLELAWAGGQGAQQHAVYVSTDEALVAAGDESVLADTVDVTSLQLTGLDIDTTYYWSVTELGGVGGDVAGPVWSLTTFGAVDEPVVEPNLVGLWTFDVEPENSLVALDMTGNGHNGMVKGDIKFVDEFYKGAVLQLPGGDNQFVDIGPVGISGNDPTTIACWAKADNTSIPDWTLVFGFTGTETGEGGNGSHFNIGSLGGPGGVGAHCWGWEETIFSDTEALEWHHYAMTYDGTTITYYGDGVQVDTDEAKSNVQDLSIRADRVHIGSRITQGSSFPGMVDDCRVYDRVLTADEIAALGAEPPTIVFVSYHPADDQVAQRAIDDAGLTVASDIGYTDLLTANGYNVYRYGTNNDPDAAILNAADLVIISRAVSSSHYSNDAATKWNSISAPTMILGGYVLRSSRMGYTDGTTMVDTTGDIKLTALDPDHPIFAGIALTDGTMDNPFAEGAVPLPTDPTILSRGISINDNTADDDVVVLGVVADASADTGPAGGMVIAEAPAGAVLTHDGGAETDILAGRRLIFLTGSREPSGVTGGEAAGLYDLYADGEQMFLNAVHHMLNPPPPSNLLTNGGFEWGNADGWGGYGDNTREVVTELVGADVPEPPIEGMYCMHVVVNSAGANFWDGGVQTYQGQVFEAGKQYTFSAWLKCATGTMQVNIKPEIAADPWAGYGDQEVTITDTWAEYSVTTPVFEEDITPTSITLHIQYAPGEFWIDDAKFSEVVE